MAEKDQSEKLDQIKQSERMQNLRASVQNVRSDVQELKGTYESDKGNAKRQTKYTVGKYKRPIAALIGIGIIAYYIFNPNLVIPEWTKVIVVGTLAGVIIGYIPATKVIEMFIQDRRKPVFVIDPESQKDVELYYVPQERIPNIEKFGEANHIETIKGMGYEVEKFEKVQVNGKEHLLWKGTWVGEKSGWEIKKDYGNIKGMRENLLPKAKKGFAYEVMWPHIMQELQDDIANMFAREFEDVAIFNGKELRSKIDQTVEKYNPDTIMENIEDKDIEERQEMKEIVENGEMNGDIDIEKLKEVGK